MSANTTPPVINVTWAEVSGHSRAMLGRIASCYPDRQFVMIYPIPRGGIPVALALQTAAAERWAAYPLQIGIVERPEDADCAVDDLIDSGRTAKSFVQKYKTNFFALLDKAHEPWTGKWVVFPWERMQNETGPEDAIVRILEYIGEDPSRQGLLDTPNRVVRSYGELFCGYGQSPKDILGTLFETDFFYDEMVVVKNVEFTSFCEHHLLPFSGVAHVGYIPTDRRVVGLSKLARLVDCYAKRLQVQERMTDQICLAVADHVPNAGAACVVEAKHMCLGCRGARKPAADMVTSSLRGAFKDKPEARAEFLNLVRG